MAEGIRALLYGKAPELPLEPLARELFASYREGGIEQVLTRYKEIKDADGGGFDMGVGQLFLLARFLERNKKNEEEIAVLELAAREHPDRAVAFMRLGDALKRAGRKDDAVKSYAQALQADPKLAPRITEQLKVLISTSP